jgi:hypothetical protein
MTRGKGKDSAGKNADDVEAGPVAGRRTSRLSPNAAASPQRLETERGADLLRASAAAEGVLGSSRSAC